MLVGPTWLKDRRTIAATAVVATLLAAFAGWTLFARQSAGKVEVSWLPNCPDVVTGSNVRPVLHARPGWRCDLELTVLNDSDHTVHVHAIEAPFVGQAGYEAVAFSTSDATLAKPESLGDIDIDATYGVDLDVPAHRNRSVHLVIGWRRDLKCNEGGEMSVEHWPTVRFSVLHRTFLRGAEQPLVLRMYDDPSVPAPAGEDDC